MAERRRIIWAEITIVCMCGMSTAFQQQSEITPFDYEDWLFEHQHGDEDEEA